MNNGKVNQQRIYIVLDEHDNVYDVSETETEAKVQARWFLPRENKYHIKTVMFRYADED